MKKFFFPLLIIANLIIAIIILQSSGDKDPNYVLLGWNDLGMHCANKTFSKMAILPPYNNLRAQVVLKGSSTSMPSLVTQNYSVTYEIPGNTYSVSKTDFWSYENALFGVNLPDNIGLTGVGLTGSMNDSTGFFWVDGIPVTPFTDADLVNESPYQSALFKLYNSSNTLLATTTNVIPVSNDISCVSSGCHSSEQNILNMHEDEGGFNPANTPILCASCHADNALGTTGSGEAPPFSEAIHGKHAGITNNCYKCHPGTNTYCFRDVMYSAGLTCQTCHGTVANVASTIENGRDPWLEEPSCGASTCHGSTYAENPGKLFKQSTGHGGLYCSACHGSPHAIVPTTVANDNAQSIALQGFAGPLSQCTVCHGYTPSSPGPHGILATNIFPVNFTTISANQLISCTPNPGSGETILNFSLLKDSKIKINVYTLEGKQVLALCDNTFNRGNYNLVFNVSSLKSGVYFVRMTNPEFIDVLKILVTE